jgi:adenylate kinase
MQIVILGPPGAGKGTQSLLIAQKLGLIHLSTGEILRKAVEQDTELGRRAKEIMQKGALVPDDIMIAIVRQTLSSEEMKSGFILDGFPRTLNQAIALDKILTELNFNDLRVVNITANDDELVKRLMLRGRKDDTIETVKHLLEVYRKQTSPIKEYYEKKCRVYDINGIGDINEINDNIINVLKEPVTRPPVKARNME